MESKLSNLYISEKAKSFNYTPIGGGDDNSKIPIRKNRIGHAEKLEQQFKYVWENAEKKQKKLNVASISSQHGVYLEIKGQSGYDLITKRLDNISQHVRICNIKTEEDNDGGKVISSTVFVPNSKRDFFLKKINQYKENIKKNKVIDTIEDINLALVDDLWLSDKKYMPSIIPVWCEIWLMYDIQENPNSIIDEFFELCEIKNIPYKNQKIIFPERIVLGIHANKKTLSDIQWQSSRVAEFKIMLTPTGFFDALSEADQRDFVDELFNRLDFSLHSNTSVCLLDTGVNNGHKLLAPVLSDDNMHTVNPEKEVNDLANHGTRMAGIATYFTLEDKLEGKDTYNIYHFIESVKLLDVGTDNSKELYGYVTENAISLAEIQNPKTNRSICMAITAEPNTSLNDGRPSSWSGVIDGIISGVNLLETSDENKKLMFISAGNTTVQEITEADDIQTAIINHTIEDPAQAWNAITVGAFTDKYEIPEKLSPTYQPVFEPGCYSPFTSSSLMWSNIWPIKPDIVLEGGNLAYDKSTNFYSELPNLQLITTSNSPTNKPLDTISMTSSATAQAAWIGANLQHHYPDLWPETIRALIIHSAEWTDVMKQNVFGNKKPNKSDYTKLLRICGYGIPNYSKAIWSASNRVNLIIEDRIQPFIKNKNNSITANEMHIHQIPWPADILLNLGDENVKMHITLSYYIEPGPGEIGWKDKYHYPSCRLQFDVNNVAEDYDNFLKRINKAMRENKKDKGDVSNDSKRWTLGTKNRDKGSVHSDIWEGTASDLSQSNYIAIYPITGWWKLRTNLKKYNSTLRYSLIVSIEAPDVDVDLYSSIKTKVESMTNVENRTAVTTTINYN